MTAQPNDNAQPPTRHRGRLNKEVIRQFVEFGCERQLFVSLGQGDARWMDPPRPLFNPQPPTRSPEFLLERGRAYEQDVYARLTYNIFMVLRNEGAQGQLVPSYFTPQHGERLRALASQEGFILLLEHQWETPESMLRWMLGLKDQPEAPLPLAQTQEGCRPDIMILRGPSTERDDWELRPAGLIAKVQRTDQRAAISIIDIKNTQPEDVGKKHFSELLFYAHSLAHYLAASGLDEQLYVSLRGHGIWPQLPLNRTRLLSLQDIEAAIEPMDWQTHGHMFEQVLEQLRALHQAAPLPIEETELRIQPACARCLYLNDCKHSLGYTQGARHLGELDVRLIPCSSNAISEQLRDRGINNAQDLLQNIEANTSPTSLIPSPLYAERPLLTLKASALERGRACFAGAQDAQDPLLKQMTVAIPKQTDVIITFNAEADPTHDRVFAFGLSAKFRAYAQRPWFEQHQRFWRFWAEAIDQPKPPSTALLDELLITLSYEQELNHSASRAELARFGDLLWSIKARGQLHIAQDNHSAFQVNYDYAFISQGLEIVHERSLCFEMVRQQQALLELSSIYEAHVFKALPSQFDDEKVWFNAPQSAIFYWSQDQLEHLRELLERHINELLTEASICQTFHKLLYLLNPAESGIAHDFLHKKIYDLRRFAESCVGLPQIINYTWHKTAQQLLHSPPHIEQRYWHDHFNYMDFLEWHHYLSTQDSAQATPLRQEVCKKSRTLIELAQRFLEQGGINKLTSAQGNPYSGRKLYEQAKLISDDYNFLARAWALYNKLTHSTQAQEALSTRLNPPAQSIGKLKAAQVDDLHASKDEQSDAWTVRFRLSGVSTNVKAKPGDYLLLMSEQRRDRAVYERDPQLITLRAMSWEPSTQSYLVEASATAAHPLIQGLQAPAQHTQEGPWYLYPNSGRDNWSHKLFEAKKDSIFTRHQLGVSWLGDRFAYLKDLLPIDQPLEHPSAPAIFCLSELYAYAPKLLNDAGALPSQGRLNTPASPSPDMSQREAIALALSQVVSCIQGPPGTGKSQTIAALIDEFICRHGAERPVKILVASASYVPLYVVLDNVIAQRDADGAPTAASSIERILLHSNSHDPSPRHRLRSLARHNKAMMLDGAPLNRSRNKLAREGSNRLEDALEPSFIMFASAHQLYYLSQPSSSKSLAYEYIHDNFAFDLIIIDEASQMPVDQILTSLCLVRHGQAQLNLPAAASITDRAALEAIRVEAIVDLEGQPLPAELLTRVVIVGDHNQLPPVQSVEISPKLRPILDSCFSYYAIHHQVPSQQLMTNYRSHKDIVGYTQHLKLYTRDIGTFHMGQHAYAPLPAPPQGLQPWLQTILADDKVVSTLIHEQRYETAISPLEAHLVCAIVAGFYQQLDIRDPERERAFWREDVGIVSPHNAQGRLIIRQLAATMTAPQSPAKSTLEPDELESLLRETIYSVEKFQGSARTLIIASMGLSAIDQLTTEETFIYDINRLNVLTSRAKQKMIMICSKNFLAYMPQRREIVTSAARYRDYALRYCNQEDDLKLDLEGDTFNLKYLKWRWHDPNAPMQLQLNIPPEHKTPPPQAQSKPASHSEQAGLEARLTAMGLDMSKLGEADLQYFIKLLEKMS